MRNKKAFGLIELMLTVAIVLVLSAGSGVIYSRFLIQNAVSNTVDQIVQNARKAQYYAMTSRKSNSSGWGLHYDSWILTLYQGASFPTRNTALDEAWTINNNVSISGWGDINFARMTGEPSMTATITISGQGNDKTVSVNSLGMISR